MYLNSELVRRVVFHFKDKIGDVITEHGRVIGPPKVNTEAACCLLYDSIHTVAIALRICTVGGAI